MAAFANSSAESKSHGTAEINSPLFLVAAWIWMSSVLCFTSKGRKEELWRIENKTQSGHIFELIEKRKEFVTFTYNI